MFKVIEFVELFACLPCKAGAFESEPIELKRLYEPNKLYKLKALF